MTGTNARGLLADARSLKEAADLIEAGKSSFAKWSIPDVFQEQGTAVLYGQSGTSKSFLAVKTALSLAGALPWFGKTVRHGCVVYLATEDRPGIEARAVAAARQLETTTLNDIVLEFMTPPPIHSDAWRNELPPALEAIQLRQEVKISAVILDTLGAAFGGNSQDDAASMTVATDRAEAIAERFRCLFLSIHHSGKDQDRGMRGSQVLKDRSDTVVTLGKKNGIVTATVEKQRNGPIGACFAFRLAPVEVVLGDHRIDTCVVAELDDAPALAPERPQASAATRWDGRLPKDTQTALETLKGLANGRGTSIGAWRTATYQAFGEREGGAKRQAFYGAKRRLVDEQVIRIEGDTVSFSV